jgi:hypothetical protein
MQGKHGYKEPKKIEGKMDGIDSYESDDNSGELGCGRSTRYSTVSPPKISFQIWCSHTLGRCLCRIRSDGTRVL